MSRDRYLMTQSLLSAWETLYLPLPSGLGEEGKEKLHQSRMEGFLRALERRPAKPSRANLDGIQFENMVTACCAGDPPPTDHRWREGVMTAGKILKGCQFQVAAWRDMRIDGLDFLLYGRLDGLRAGVIYDLKFSRKYQPGKYLDSPQHPMYFACVPEASRFDYVVYTGKDICTESYQREETPPVSFRISHFIQYLTCAGLEKTYRERWKAH